MACTQLFKIYTNEQWQAEGDADTLPMTSLDKSHGYWHLSTEQQLPGIIDRFFHQQAIVVVAINYDAISTSIQWEFVEADQCKYPHAYQPIPRSAIDDVSYQTG